MHIGNNLYLKKAATRFPDLQHYERNEIPETKRSDISALPQPLNTQTSYHNIPEGSRNYTTFSVPLLLGSMCFHVDSAAPLIQILPSWISEGKRQPQVDTSERENSEARPKINSGGTESYSCSTGMRLFSNQMSLPVVPELCAALPLPGF